MKVKTILLIFMLSFFDECFSDCPAPRCHWTSWEGWRSCSRSCGGGTRHRSRSLCCKSDLVGKGDACNRACGVTSSGYHDMESCNQWCSNGGTYRDRCLCRDGFYDSCCSSRCSSIANCKTVTCTSSWNKRCKECIDEGVNPEHSIFWPIYSRRICQATCSWKQNWCWPGVCSDHLASSCNCSIDFRLGSGVEKMCAIHKTPDLVTCKIGIESTTGKIKNSTSNSGGCPSEGPSYINFQPAKLAYNFESEFHVTIKEDKPLHINGSNFGIVGAEIYIQKTLKNRSREHIAHYSLSTSNGCKQTFSRDSPFPGSPITCAREVTPSVPILKDGERLCLTFIAQGGGYLQTKDFHNTVSSKHYYSTTQSTKEVCFRYDNAPPGHCLSDRPPCSTEPIQLESRLSKISKISVLYNGWADPYPDGGFPDQASGIKQYTIGIHEVVEINGTTLIMKDRDIKHVTTNSSERLTFNLPNQPALYAITLEVLDVAENFKKARRFVLYDNSSSIKQNHNNKLNIDSASKDTNYTWETHHGDVCLSWRGRYFNSYQKSFNLLRPIAPDYHHLFNGIYEQTSGLLPVSGTPNVDGIINFTYSWNLDNGNFVNETIPNFLGQKFCKNFGLQDGNALMFKIISTDIMKNQLTESIFLNVDASAPDINNIWLIKDNHKQLFVHNSTDLSKMTFNIDIMDIHSGILTIEWRLGTTNGGSDLGVEFIRPNQSNVSSCPSNSTCYCPKIGKCENYQYKEHFKKLVTTKAQHNREYYATIIATNNAKLVTVERIEILVDDSAPEEGVVIEGSVTDPDVDYINGNEIIISWHGFIDHESGIRLYRLGIHRTCLSLEELNSSSHDNFSQIHETTETSIKLRNLGTGKFYTSVVAFNNAMEPSGVVCSDGFIRDSTPPTIEDFRVLNAKSSELIACYNGEPWFILENMTRIRVLKTDACINFCNQTKELRIISVLPIGNAPSNDTEIADDLCRRKYFHHDEWFIYLPSNKISLSWNIYDRDSQIRDIYVGFASDESQLVMPDIKGYEVTHSINRYSRFHTGLDTGVPFYIMVKVVNKADLETAFPFGPIIIDETPPLLKGKVIVSVNGDNVIAIWNNETFTESEQRENLTTILFRIGTKVGYVTPYLQAPLQADCLGAENHICIRYPLRRLQVQNNEAGHVFHFVLHVYNTAGLFTTVTTDDFTIPSLYPPGHGIVFDKDPTKLEVPGDIDYRFGSKISCLEWNGFWHHENVSFEIGIGTSPDTADVIPLVLYGNINGSNTACIQLRNYEYFKRYYTILRATCSGGSSTSASDGFVIINLDQNDTSLSFGQNLANTSKIEQYLNLNLSEKPFKWTTSKPLDVGKEYMFEIYGQNLENVTVESSDVIWRNPFTSQLRIFIPMDAYPNFLFNKLTNNAFLEKLKITQKYQNITYKASKESLRVFLRVGPLFKRHVTRYEMALLKLTCSFPNISKECLEVIEPYNSIGLVENTTLTNIPLQDGHTYYISLKSCFQNICSNPQLSNALVIEYRYPTTGVITAFISSTKTKEYRIEASFGQFQCKSAISNPYDQVDAAGYRWSVMQGNEHHLTKWIPVLEHSNNSLIHIQDEVVLPVYIHSGLTLCVQGICSSGSVAVICQRFDAEPPNVFTKEVLYEIDSSSFDIFEIKHLLQSENIGHKLQLLHTNEMNFCKPTTKVIGAIPNAYERIVDWYLLSKTPNIPTECNKDKGCIQHITTKGGMVTFKRTYLSPNTIHFICAVSNTTIIERELFKEKLDELHLCGNGFIVDDDPPAAGNVSIRSNVNGFLTSGGEMTVFWKGFSDLHDDIGLRYASSIKSYSIAIGSNPEGQDVLPFTDVGQATSHVMKNLTLINGNSYIATVKAFDYVGHEVVSVSNPVTIDTTPPVNGSLHIGNGFGHIHTLHANKLTIHWEGFEDLESGIESLLVGIGSHPDSSDIVPLEVAVGGFADIKANAKLVDGHQYYATLVAINYAGLATRSVSLPVKVDATPPIKGHMNDGNRQNKTDIDYQFDTRTLNAYWSNFNDPHSGIKHYSVGVGTYPGTFDVEQKTNIGLQTDHSWNGHYIPGVRYYVTVEACNCVGSCVSVSSDGVIIDNSPPVPGIVHIGLSDRHESFVGHNTVLSVQWFGFQDPHSDLDHFEWCIGTKPYTCDEMPFENILLSNSVTKAGLDLPLTRELYVCVRAFNKLGLFSTRSSDKFRVDITPPKLISKPKFVTDGMALSHKNGTQWDNSLLRIAWEFQDKESAIINHEIQLRINKNGHTVFETTTIGSENKIIIRLRNGTLLKSGDRYTARVTACNTAGLCQNSSTDKLLIDSSPPTLGGFKNSMKWRKKEIFNGTYTELNLTWYGFTDLESAIEKYVIYVSRNYSGFELSNGPREFVATSSKDQRKNVLLSEVVESGESIILSIWAYNSIGLRSSIGKVTVILVGTNVNQTEGFLEIQRHSCISHYCNNDCTCAVVGLKCEHEHLPVPCMDISNRTLPSERNISVFIGDVQSSSPITVTTSSSCLSAFWNVVNKEDILRFEWTFGYYDGKIGDGFDIRTEQPWHDVGHDTNMTYFLTRRRQLVHREKFVIYVKAWLSYSNYAIFKSKPVLVDLTPAQIRTGSQLKESIDNCQSDIDFLQQGTDIKICWNNVMFDAQGKIMYYELIGGTSPYGDDFVSVVKLNGTDLQFIINGRSMTPGTRYFFTVMATNHVGFVTTVISDGIMIDNEQPVSGVVFNTDKHRNIHFQSSTSEFGLSFHGFDDHMSYIKYYNISLIDVTSNSTILQKTIGIRNSIVLHSLNLKHNHSYRASVYAVDAAGHVSDVSYSAPVSIDTTPPNGVQCSIFKDIFNFNMTENPSTIKRKKNILTRTVHLNDSSFYKILIQLTSQPILQTVLLEIDGHIRTLKLVKTSDGILETEYNFLSTKTGDTKVKLQVDERPSLIIHQMQLLKCEDLDVSISLPVVHLCQVSADTFSVFSMVEDRESKIKNIATGVGTTKGGFQILPLATYFSGHHLTFDAILQHNSSVYVTSVLENHAGLQSEFHSNPIIVDLTPPQISIPQANLIISDRFINDNSVNKSWDEHRNVTTTSVLEYEYNITENYESGNKTDTRQPVKITEATMNILWSASDDESGIKACYCAVGSRKGVSDIRQWELSENKTFCSFSNLHAVHGMTMYPSVKCINNVELFSIQCSEGVVEAYERPNITAGRITFLPDNGHNNPNTFNYAGQRFYTNIQSSKSMVTVYWQGIKDMSGINHYETLLLKNKENIQWIDTGLRNYHSFHKSLEPGQNYTVLVRASNNGDVFSHHFNDTIYIENDLGLTGTGKLPVITARSKGCDLRWNEVFHMKSGHQLLYQVTIGSRTGNVDLLKATSTFHQHIEFDCEGHLSSYYVTITAYTPTEDFKIYRGTINLKRL